MARRQKRRQKHNKWVEKNLQSRKEDETISVTPISPTEPCYFDTLPVEMVHHVLKFLPSRSVLEFTKTNKFYNSLLKDKVFAKKLCRKKTNEMRKSGKSPNKIYKWAMYMGNSYIANGIIDRVARSPIDIYTGLRLAYKRKHLHILKEILPIDKRRNLICRIRNRTEEWREEHHIELDYEELGWNFISNSYSFIMDRQYKIALATISPEAFNALEDKWFNDFTKYMKTKESDVHLSEFLEEQYALIENSRQ